MSDARYTVVIAEDEPRMRDYLLRKVGELDGAFRCLGSASDGEEAVELVERFLPHVLITDIKMPLLDGLAVARLVRQTAPDLHVVIVSGYSEFEYARKAIEVGVEDYLLKPLDPDALRATLQRVRIRLDASVQDVERAYGLDHAGSKDDLVKATQVFLQENFARPYSLEQLASALGVKPAYLLRVYHKLTSSTPTQDLIRLRIERAKRLLVGHPALEIKQVADAVGYDDPLYFSRLFKKETGVAPTAFREERGSP